MRSEQEHVPWLEALPLITRKHSIVRLSRSVAGTADRLIKPRPRHRPFALDGRGRTLQNLRRLFDRQPGEVTQLDDLALFRVDFLQFPQSEIESQ